MSLYMTLNPQKHEKIVLLKVDIEYFKDSVSIKYKENRVL